MSKLLIGRRWYATLSYSFTQWVLWALKVYASLFCRLCIGLTVVITGIVIFGLPGESRSEMEDTSRLLSDLQVEGIKFHHLYIVKNTELNRLYRAGNYRPNAQEDYVEMVAWALATLPKGTVIQRLTGDPPRNQLVTPDWSLDKRQTIAMIQDRIKNV